MKTAIIVDLQYDFLEGGSLAVAGADDAYVKKIEKIRSHFDQVILTADKHPEGHVSFSIFPPHCIAGTHGAELAISEGSDLLLTKGEDLNYDEFSAFTQGKHIERITGDEVYVFGLAGDYCVKQTLLDLLEFVPSKKIFAIKDLIYSVDGSLYGPTDYFEGRVVFVDSKDL
jgi:nicotinamidase/pyrazinamidase